MADTVCLNQFLFNRLESYYGRGEVGIINYGCENHWRVEWETRPDSTEKKAWRKMDYPGEEYVVRCRLCRDHRARLHINHRWGVLDPATQSYNLWLANCYNEQCYSEYENQKHLYELIYGLGRRASRTSISILPGKPGTVPRLQHIRMPGMMYRLDTLAEQMPDHPAIEYLHGRGFDPVKLARLWNTQFCASSRIHHANNRIIIPITMNGMQVGWQARYVGDDVDGRPFNAAKVPKYFSSPGFHRTLCAYNMERALRHQTVVVTEGPSDAWRVGPMALAALGKTVSPHVRSLIVDGMKRHGRDGLVAVVFDAEPGSQKHTPRKPKPHPTDVLVSQLSSPLAEFGVQVVPIRLPPKSDPGSMDREQLRELIKEQAAAAGAVARFAKP